MNQNSLEQTDAERVALERWIKWVNSTPKIALLVLCTLLLAYVCTFWHKGWPQEYDKWGQLGDYIGGLLNPLVAGFALMALVVSVRLQKAELAATRKELENSRLAMEEQAKTAEQQRREQRFFDFLNIYQTTVQAVILEDREKISRSGKKGFQYLVSSYESPFWKLLYLITTKPSEVASFLEEPDLTKNQIELTWAEESSVLHPYFRTVFIILREAEQILKEDHVLYIKLFRAQLSSDEVNLLAMNLLYAEEGKKMRLLAANYGLLKHMPANPLRKIAETELDPLSFGRKWVEERLLIAREAKSC